MSDIDLFSESGSPFDAARQVRADGTEFWSARDLLPLMGYARWENFYTPIQRAMKTAENQGMDVAALFLRSQEKTGGRPREDFELARYAAYLVAMNGDPNIPEVAAAQHSTTALDYSPVTRSHNALTSRSSAHQPAEHAGDAFLQGDQSVSAADGIGAHSIDDRLGDRQVIGDLGVEGNEIHRVLRFVARAVTRYVAGALFFVAAWQLQRMGWVRRAAMVRPSDTTTSGGAA